MKTTWDELMRYAPEQEYSLPPLEDSETERLLKRTMAKLNTTGKARKPQKFVRKFLLAAALAALLCVSVFAPRILSAGSTSCSDRPPRWSKKALQATMRQLKLT